MPTYVCSAAAGRLTPIQKTEIVRSITAIHHQETGAPRYLVQVIFHEGHAGVGDAGQAAVGDRESPPGSRYLFGRPGEGAPLRDYKYMLGVR